MDTTFLQTEGQTYMFTFQPTFRQWGGTLLQYRLENHAPSDCHILTDDRSLARPGGNFFQENGKIMRVSQDCGEEYGGGLVFSEVDEIWPNYQEHAVKRICPDDIRVESKQKYTGIHTYNRCCDLEVIDLKYECYSLKEYIARKRVRKIFLYKY